MKKINYITLNCVFYHQITTFQLILMEDHQRHRSYFEYVYLETTGWTRSRPFAMGWQAPDPGESTAEDGQLDGMRTKNLFPSLTVLAAQMPDLFNPTVGE